MRYETESNNLTIQNTENGYLSKIILKGKTLVNDWTVDRYDVILSNNITSLVTKETTSNSCKLTINSNLTSITESNWRILQAYPKKWCLNKIKPNTRYTAFFNLETNKLNMSANFRLCKNDGSEDLSSSVEFTTKNGLIRAEFQTLSTLPIPTSEHHFYLSCNELRDAGNYMKLSNVCIFEGVVDNISNYVDGLKSVGDGVDNIIISTKNSDSSQEVLKDKRVLLYKDKDGIWKKPILRSMDDEVEDEIKIVDDRYIFTKRCNQIVLDGRWTYRDDLNYNNETTVKPFLSSAIEDADISQGNTVDFPCDRFNTRLIYNVANVVEGIYYSNAKNIHVRINKDKLNSSNAQGFKEWVTSNPITMVYKLAEEEVYECTPISGASFKDETTWQIESGAISPNSSFETDYTFSNAVVRVKDAKLFNQAMTDNLKYNLSDKGVEVSSEDKMSTLVDKVNEMKNYPHLPKWYEPNKVWIRLADMPRPRSEMAVEAIGNKVYALAGYDGNAGKFADCYDLDSNTWTTKATPPTKRYYVSSATFGSEIHIFGGTDGIRNQDSNYMYDTVTNTWTTKASVPFTIRDNKSVALDNKAYLVGGEILDSAYHTQLIVYDKASNTWTTRRGVLTMRKGHGLYVDKKRKIIYSIGGLHSSERYISMDAYDTTTQVWKSSVSMPTYRNHFVVGDLGGKICVLGGYEDSSQSIIGKATFTFDLDTQKWNSTDEQIAPMVTLGVAGTNVGKNIIMLGGYQNTATYCLIKK